MSDYRKILDFGSNYIDHTSNPINYCLGDTLNKSFLNPTSTNMISQFNKPCQAFMSDYCSLGWDNVCEISSSNVSESYPNMIGPTYSNYDGQILKAGEIMILNTAMKKYLSKDSICFWEYEIFDPMSSNSPLIRKLNFNKSYIFYEIEDVKNIDNDEVMNKILENPRIGIDILGNIYSTMKFKKRLQELNGTKLGKFYDVNKEFFENKKY